MKLSKKHGIVVVAFLAVVACGWGIFQTYRMATRNIQGQPPLPASQSQVQQNTPQGEIDSVKDLVDGEYTFPPMDTSTWQTYRNEELGFEVKIPKNWELANSYEEDDIGGKYLNFGERGASYDMPEGGKIDSAVLIRASARDSARAMPLREYVQRRKTSYDERLYQFSLNGTNAVMLGSDEVDFFEGNKSWSISFQLYHDGNKDTYNAEYQVFLGIVQTFKFFK